jgi:hypothetical protein
MGGFREEERGVVATIATNCIWQNMLWTFQDHQPVWPSNTRLHFHHRL